MVLTRTKAYELLEKFERESSINKRNSAIPKIEEFFKKNKIISKSLLRTQNANGVFIHLRDARKSKRTDTVFKMKKAISLIEKLQSIDKTFLSAAGQRLAKIKK